MLLLRVLYNPRMGKVDKMIWKRFPPSRDRKVRRIANNRPVTFPQTKVKGARCHGVSKSRTT